MKPKIIIISGPTASGKSSLAVDIALKYNGVIINADAMQIYQEIPIITAQPLSAIKIVPHLLYGIISAQVVGSVALYLELAKNAIKQVLQQGKLPILVGGTGLYLKSLVYGISSIPDIDPKIRSETRELYVKLGPEKFYHLLLSKDSSFKNLNMLDKQRVMRAYEVFIQTAKPIHQFKNTTVLFNADSFLQIGLIQERKILYQNINKRFLEMIENKVIEEVANLNQLTMNDHLPARKAHGIREITAYLQGKISLEEAIIKSQQITRNYAKRQITWIKHQMPEMITLSYAEIAEIMPKCEQLITNFLLQNETIL